MRDTAPLGRGDTCDGRDAGGMRGPAHEGQDAGRGPGGAAARLTDAAARLTDVIGTLGAEKRGGDHNV